MEAALDRVRELGGSVEDMDVDGDEESQAKYGRFKLCRDDQGSPFGLHQPPAARIGPVRWARCPPHSSPAAPASSAPTSATTCSAAGTA